MTASLSRSRLADVAHHDGQQAPVYEGLVDLPVSLAPLFRREAVVARMQVLVAEVHAVAGEVLAAGYEARVLGGVEKKLRIFEHPFGLGAEGAGVGDGVAEVHVYVHDGGEGPVYARCEALGGADLGKTARAGLVVRCGDAELVCEIGPVRNSARAALFEVRGVEEGDARRGVYGGKLLRQLRLGAGAVEHRAYALVTHEGAQLIERAVPAHDAEELAGLLTLVHRGEGVQHPAPGAPRLRSGKRVCLSDPSQLSLQVRNAAGRGRAAPACSRPGAPASRGTPARPGPPAGGGPLRCPRRDRV